jgi:hypothetical protein
MVTSYDQGNETSVAIKYSGFLSEYLLASQGHCFMEWVS